MVNVTFSSRFMSSKLRGAKQGLSRKHFHFKNICWLFIHIFIILSYFRTLKIIRFYAHFLLHIGADHINTCVWLYCKFILIVVDLLDYILKFFIFKMDLILYNNINVNCGKLTMVWVVNQPAAWFFSWHQWLINESEHLVLNFYLLAHSRSNICFNQFIITFGRNHQGFNLCHHNFDWAGMIYGSHSFYHEQLLICKFNTVMVTLKSCSYHWLSFFPSVELAFLLNIKEVFFTSSKFVGEWSTIHVGTVVHDGIMFIKFNKGPWQQIPNKMKTVFDIYPKMKIHFQHASKPIYIKTTKTWLFSTNNFTIWIA